MCEFLWLCSLFFFSFVFFYLLNVKEKRETETEGETEEETAGFKNLGITLRTDAGH